MKVHLSISRVLPHAPERIWQTIRDFNGLPSWHPMIARSAIEDGKSGDQVGAVRNFDTHEGGNIREQLLALNDRDFVIIYSILESGMGVSDYVAEIALQRISHDNSTLVKWTAQFDCADDQAAELEQFVGQTVFQGGLAHLAKILSI